MTWGDVSWKDVVSSLRRLPPSMWLLAVGLHAFTYLMRAARFRVLLPAAIRPGMGRMLVASSAHNMASYLLPAKTGEATFVIYSRIYCGVRSSRGLAALLVSRFVDAAAMSLALAIAALTLQASGHYRRLDWLGLLAAGLVVASGLFLLASMRGEVFTQLLRRTVRLVGLRRWRWGRVLSSKLFTLGQSLEVAGRRGRLLAAFAFTVPMWVSVYGFFWVLGRNLGLPPEIGLSEITFGSSLASFANLLPLNGAAGAGTQELGWVTGFHTFLGVDKDLALATGIGAHVVQLVDIVAFGLLAHVAMGFLPRLSGESEQLEARDRALVESEEVPVEIEA